MTGYYRDGFCRTGGGDFGVHVVCAQVCVWSQVCVTRECLLVAAIPGAGSAADSLLPVTAVCIPSISWSWLPMLSMHPAQRALVGWDCSGVYFQGL
jgi:uncharacterized protein (DUF2237 family)